MDSVTLSKAGIGCLLLYLSSGVIKKIKMHNNPDNCILYFNLFETILTLSQSRIFELMSIRPDVLVLCFSAAF